MFHNLRPWFDQCRAFVGGRSIEKHYSDDVLAEFSSEIGRSEDAFHRADHDQAVGLWRDLASRHPDLSVTSKRVLDLALDLSCFEEAEALMQKGRRRFPGRGPLFAAGSARVAHRRGDLAEATRQCAIIRGKFPGVAEGYTVAAASLADLGRSDEAEALIERGVLELPGALDVHVQHARYAMQRRDWCEALKRWQVVQSRFVRAIGPLGVAQCLKMLGGPMLKRIRFGRTSDNGRQANVNRGRDILRL